MTDREPQVPPDIARLIDAYGAAEREYASMPNHDNYMAAQASLAALEAAIAVLAQPPTLPKEPSEEAVKAVLAADDLGSTKYANIAVGMNTWIRDVLRAAYAVDAAPSGEREPAAHPDALTVLDRLERAWEAMALEYRHYSSAEDARADVALIRAALSGQKEEAP